MSAKNVVDIIKLLSDMDCNHRDNLAYFAVGMLYGMSVLEATYKEVPDSDKKQKEETE